jgi:hypothetical protein
VVVCSGHAFSLLTYVRAHKTKQRERYSKIRNLRYLSGDYEDTDAVWSDGSLQSLSGYKTDGR